MPFDALTQAKSVEELIGLTPIPDYLVAEHKAEIESAYRKSEHFQLLRPRPGLIHWSNVNFPTPAHLRNWMMITRVHPLHYPMNLDIPQAVVALADTVVQRLHDEGIEGAETVAEYLYVDPILSLAVGWRRLCLGIWDVETKWHLFGKPTTALVVRHLAKLG